MFYLYNKVFSFIISLMTYRLIIVILFIRLAAEAACNGLWTGASGIDTNWGTLGNWTSCIPQSQNDAALFSSPTSSITVNVNIAPQISSLTFNNSSSYTLSGAGPLTFLNTTTDGSAFLTNTLGRHVFSVPLQVNNTSLDILNHDTLTIQNTFTDLGTSSLQLYGLGSLTNLNHTSFSLNGDLTVTSSLNNVSTSVVTTLEVQDLLLRSGAINNTNHREVTGIANRGSVFESSSATISGGSFTLLNTGRIDGANSYGSLFEVTGSLLMTSGASTLNNQGEVVEGSGCRLSCNQFQLDGGSVLLTDSGNVHGPFAEGNALSVTNGLTINSGSLINGTSSPSHVGVTSLVIARNILVNGGSFTNRSIVRSETVIINQDGVVGGNGDFASLTLDPAALHISNNGTVIPGDPFLGGTPARLSFLGGYIQSSTGTLGINILNSSDFSHLIVDETAGIAGNLAIGLTPGFSIVPGETFLILEALGGITGTFNDPAPLCLLIPHLQYFPDFVLLSFTPNLCSYIAEFVETIFSSVNANNLFLTAEMEKIRRRSECCQGPWNFYMGPVGRVGDVQTQDQQIGFDYWSAGAQMGLDYSFLHSGSVF